MNELTRESTYQVRMNILRDKGIAVAHHGGTEILIHSTSHTSMDEAEEILREFILTLQREFDRRVERSYSV